MPAASTSSISPDRRVPSGRQMPDRPLSRASRVTRDAPAARSSPMQSIHSLAVSSAERVGSLNPTSEMTVKSSASFRM